MSEASHSTLMRAIMHTLAYADVFDYPLTAPEVHRHLTGTRASVETLARALDEATQGCLIARVDGYFTLLDRESIVEIRKRRAKVASRLWPKAARYGRLLAWLPFVRMVAVTGSLAMNNTEEGKDIDYMLVTAPNHLWTCRALSLLIARFAKLEGVNLCPNYLVTTNALELNEHSLYVAHELVQMIPLSGMEIYNEMRRLNGWIEEYLPNAIGAPRISNFYVIASPGGAKQSPFEIIFNLLPVSLLERWEMKRKINKLTREQSSSSEAFFSVDTCKGHVDRHGEKVLTALAVRLASLGTSHQIDRKIPLNEAPSHLSQSR